MSPLAVILAVSAAIAVCLPAPGPFVAMALGIGAVGTGLVGYRRRHAPGPQRLWGAAAVTLGGLALTLAMVRYGLTLAAVDRLETWVQG